jgi:hypothetical protein
MIGALGMDLAAPANLTVGASGPHYWGKRYWEPGTFMRVPYSISPDLQ